MKKIKKDEILQKYYKNIKKIYKIITFDFKYWK